MLIRALSLFLVAKKALKNVLMELDENSSVAVEVIDKVIQGLSKSLLEVSISPALSRSIVLFPLTRFW